ncbi:hypothetical protein PGT21_037026 [Puccinia graminis f. sp. tritici]|uniref:Uncharacterized protein n=1 Tax=Puccinia graminis f. sp. tritici TaxID=56615 RepID=A0A5B0R417_PUCGR|nr:hypothetical protein PGT21_037026 [Puccinia graminis f. sp. tritici]
MIGSKDQTNNRIPAKFRNILKLVESNGSGEAIAMSSSLAHPSDLPRKDWPGSSGRAKWTDNIGAQTQLRPVGVMGRPAPKCEGLIWPSRYG